MHSASLFYESTGDLGIKLCKSEVMNISISSITSSSRLEVFFKKVFLKISQNSQENKQRSRSPFFNKVANLRPATVLKRETPTHGFSCRFCEIFKKTFLHKTPPVAASVTSFSITQSSSWGS